MPSGVWEAHPGVASTGAVGREASVSAVVSIGEKVVCIAEILLSVVWGVALHCHGSNACVMLDWHVGLQGGSVQMPRRIEVDHATGRQTRSTQWSSVYPSVCPSTLSLPCVWWQLRSGQGLRDVWSARMLDARQSGGETVLQCNAWTPWWGLFHMRGGLASDDCAFVQLLLTRCQWLSRDRRITCQTLQRPAMLVDHCGRSFCLDSCLRCMGHCQCHFCSIRVVANAYWSTVRWMIGLRHARPAAQRSVPPLL